MAGDLWTPVISMVGVAVGGALTYLTQRTTQRAADRAEEQRRAAAQAEERRAEQIRTVLEFAGASDPATSQLGAVLPGGVCLVGAHSIGSGARSAGPDARHADLVQDGLELRRVAALPPP
ncbi:hypothetical protein SY2F82_35380 [Streptomyces sp. Y2F8-2]|nr:hypothetical protein SY2F82_35380 [Streptomyces sp. Y2F8-2]